MHSVPFQFHYATRSKQHTLSTLFGNSRLVTHSHSRTRSPVDSTPVITPLYSYGVARVIPNPCSELYCPSLGRRIQLQKKQAARTCRKKKSIKAHWVSKKAKQSGEEEELQRKIDRLRLRFSLLSVESFSSLVFCSPQFEVTGGLSAAVPRTLLETVTRADHSGCGDGGDAGASWTAQPGQSLHAVIRCSSYENRR